MNAVQTQERQERATLIPLVDVLEDATGLTLLVDMPGVAKDAIELKVDGDTLTIAGEITARNPEGLRAVYAEVQLARYRRSFTLSRELDTQRVEAVSKDGVLRLRIPKQPSAQPRRIEVRAD